MCEFMLLLERFHEEDALTGEFICSKNTTKALILNLIQHIRTVAEGMGIPLFETNRNEDVNHNGNLSE